MSYKILRRVKGTNIAVVKCGKCGRVREHNVKRPFKCWGRSGGCIVTSTSKYTSSGAPQASGRHKKGPEGWYG